jgi:nitroreductase
MKLSTVHQGAEEVTTVYKRKGIKGFLHAVLPENSYAWLRGLRLRFVASPLGQRVSLLGAGYLSFVARSGFLSGLHYTLFSSEFSREHRAVLAARGRHIRDVIAGRGNLYMLRRNVHRLEKGLIMKPPRPIFGLDKIGETVHAYIACLQQLDQTETGVKSSLEWAKSILDAYFARVADHPIVAEARARYLAAGTDSRMDLSVSKTPYRRTTPANLPTIEQLEDLAHFRRSVRWFSDKPVPREALDRAIRVAMESPSACNRQPFRYEFFDTRELVNKVGSIPKGTPGWLHQIPCFVVIIGKFDAFRFERDRHVPYIDGCLSAMGLIYALEVQGISSCCVNFPDFPETERRMAEVLKLPPWERAIMCLAVGYPDMDERVLFSQKFPLEVARRYNFERVSDKGQAG